MVKRQRGTEAAPIEDALCDMTAEKNRRDGNSAEEDLKKWEKEVTESGVEAVRQIFSSTLFFFTFHFPWSFTAQ